MRSKLSSEAIDFLVDASGFKADYDSSWNPCMYWEFLNSDYDRCCGYLYPRGGHSQVIAAMEKAIVDNGVKVFKSEPVECINKSGNKYQVRTARRFFDASRLVIAIPNIGLVGIGGNVAERIISQDEFQIPAGVPVFTLPTWWPEQWWESLRSDPNANMLAQSNSHCFTRAEFYGVPYLKGQNVSRSIYCDDPTCIEIWKNIWEKDLK